MIVVDTNILIYRWLEGPKTAAVEALVRMDPVWAAPLLWRSEFRNVLAGYVRAGRVSATDAEQMVRHSSACLLGGEHALAEDSVWPLILRSNCSAYDCEFAALAGALGTILVTEDRLLLQAFPTFCRSLSAVVN